MRAVSVSSSKRSLAVVPLASKLPGQADVFVNSVGVNTKFGFNSSPNVLLFPSVSTALESSGILHIRDGYQPTGGYLSRLNPLAQHGINHSLEIMVGDTPAGISSKLTAFLPNVDFVEPQNEYDLSGGANWAPTMVALQKLIYTTVRANPAFNNVVVLGPSLSNAAHASSLGPLDAYEDAGNLHYSLCDFNPGTSAPSQALSRWIGFERASTVTKPIWSTEVDLTDNSAQNCGLPDSIVAKYTPRSVTERWNAGMPRSYFYELQDWSTEGSWGTYGLLHQDGSLKPQFTTLQSMLGLLADPGSRFTPTPVSYALSGAWSNIHQTLVQKRDGSNYLMLWQELPAWDIKTRTPITVAPELVTLNFPSAVTGSVYSYGADNTLVSSPLPNTTAFQIPVADSIVFVKFTT